MDENLPIERIPKNCNRYFSYIYEKFSMPVSNNILRIVSLPEDADDILQNVFLKLHESQDKIFQLPPDAIKAWLFRVSYNESINYLRHEIKKRELLQGLILENDLRQGNDEVKESTISRLREAIQQLPPRKKQVIELCKMNNKTYVEAASIMGISPNTVKDHLSESVRMVRKYLKREPLYTIIASGLLLL